MISHDEVIVDNGQLPKNTTIEALVACRIKLLADAVLYISEEILRHSHPSPASSHGRIQSSFLKRELINSRPKVVIVGYHLWSGYFGGKKCSFESGIHSISVLAFIKSGHGPWGSSISILAFSCSHKSLRPFFSTGVSQADVHQSDCSWSQTTTYFAKWSTCNEIAE